MLKGLVKLVGSMLYFHFEKCINTNKIHRVCGCDREELFEEISEKYKGWIWYLFYLSSFMTRYANNKTTL